MKGLLLKKPGDIELTEVPVPRPGKGEVLVKVDNIGLCGSDIHLYHGTYAGPRKYPLFFGHEWAGRVEDVGPGVSGFNRGDPVTGECALWCGKCFYCQMDRNLCQHIEKFGITVDGASRELFLQKSRYLHTVERNIDMSVLSLTEPLTVGCHGVAKAESAIGALKDKRVLVMGAGTIGLSTLMVLKKLALCDHVEVYDPVASRMELALELGANQIADVEFVSGLRRDSSSESYRGFYSNLTRRR